MKKISDSSGYIQYALCTVILFVNHGLRDYLITGLPSQVLNESAAESNLSHEFSVHLRHGKNLFNGLQANPYLYLDSEKGWTSASVGGVLSIVHWGALIPLILSPYIVPRVRRTYILLASLLASGVVSMFAELSAKNGFVGLLVLRLCQGILQGWCYPLVFYILQDVIAATYIIPYFFLFLAPWLGSALATLLGCVNDPYVGGYVFGSLSILTAVFTYFLSFSPTDEANEKTEKAWVECLTSPAVWSCLVLQMTTVWALHTLLVGLSFTLYFKLNRNDLMWLIPIVIFVGGVVARIVAATAMHLLRNHFLSPLNRRRSVIAIGSMFIIVALITNGASGVESEFALFGVTLLGVGGGVGILLVGIRLNLHDLGPIFPIPFLILGSISGTIGAGGASLLFPILAQIDNFDPEVNNETPWRTAWMIPTVLVFISCCVHMFLVSVIPLPHQTLVNQNTIPVLKLNGVETNKEDIETKSFKSVKSGFSFKTAVSRPRTRTTSFKTVDESFDVELHSIADSKSDECISIGQNNDEDNLELKSVKSGATSFKSVHDNKTGNADGGEPPIILDARELDRTTEWLSTYYNTDSKLEQQTSAEKQIVEKNTLIALLW